RRRESETIRLKTLADHDKATIDALQRDIAQLFFFSSRRRHTSFSRDWSSDVCSSDLSSMVAAGRRGCHARGMASRIYTTTGDDRSEERRVGKECRGQEAPYDQKKK